MSKTINGASIRKMFHGAHALLDENKDYVDSLNVFPVPDGDTGINMTLTLKSVLKEVETIKSNELGVIAGAVSRGGLKGARGNSGVILSQIFKGMMAELSRVAESRNKNAKSNTNVVEINTKQLAQAIIEGGKVAYSAVTVPKEGTILTVIREMGEEAKKIAKNNEDILTFLKLVLEVGEESLARTPELLPVLKKAGVVDSGGRGLLIIFNGFVAALDGSVEVKMDFSTDGKLNLGDGEHGGSDLGEIEFAYCTEFNVMNMHKTTTEASIDKLRDKLCRMGDSVVCVGDLEMVKVHVHTNEPGEALTAALKLGEITNLKVENMLEQCRELMASHQIEEKEQGIVVVAAGEGIAQVFKDLGVDFVIKGGQTMNPSAEDIATAADRVHAKTVFIFPNNKNIILAARHAQELCKRNLVVIPTKTINEGISACIGFDDTASIGDNTQTFLQLAESVKSGSVTYAVRNTQLNRFSIKEGEVLGLDSKTVVAKGAKIGEVTTKVIEKLMDSETTSVTLFYGESIKEKDAGMLHDALMAKWPNVDFNMINGGQPVYYYLISVE